jgi:hypothetical protein
MEYCICGHKKSCHMGNLVSYPAESILWHKFKLDNLKLIEDLAKERKLI